jgi:hypothetical protein
MILVDEIHEYKSGPKHGPREFRHWCHLASDDLSVVGLEELHRFAVSIGLRREWFQNHHNHPHYDLAPWGREAAIEAGAVPVTSRELVRRCSRSWQGRRNLPDLS